MTKQLEERAHSLDPFTESKSPYRGPIRNALESKQYICIRIHIYMYIHIQKVI